MLALLLALVLVLQVPAFDEYVKAQQALAANPKSEAGIVALVSILYQLEQTDKAIALLQPFVKTNPGAARARLFLALGYAREEKYEQARVLAAQVATELPRDHYSQHVLGLSLFGLNRFDQAEARFKRALELKPDFADAHFQLGLLYARKPEALEQSRAAFQRAIEAGYRTAESYKNLASANIKLGRFDEAIEHLNTALQLDSTFVDAYFLMADAFRKSGSSEKSAEAMKKFQELNSSATDRKQLELKSQGLYQEGMNLLGKDDFTRAYAAFRAAADAAPRLDTAHYRMAQIDYLAGRNTRAIQNIRGALELNPFEAEYYFVLARCLEETDVPAAIEAATKAVSLNPGTADFHNLLGNLFTKRADYARAVQSYQRATELDPRNEAFRRNLSAARQKLPRQQ